MIEKVSYIGMRDFSVPRYREVMETDGVLLVEFKDTVDLFTLIQKVGTPHVHKESDQYIWDIKPQQGVTMQGLARSQTYEEFTWHTDCSFEVPAPTYVALYVVQEDQQGGGVTKLIDFKKLVGFLSEDVIGTLQEDFPFMIPKEFFKGEREIKRPIVFDGNKVAYRKECIHFEACTPKQVAAVTEMERAIQKYSEIEAITVPKNSVLFVDNLRYLHSRTKVKDPKRHLQRVRYF